MNQKLPRSLLDPISQELFTDPVIVSDGHTYERSSILAWFERCKQQGKELTSPITGELIDGSLQDNLVVRQLVVELKSGNRQAEPAAGLEEVNSTALAGDGGLTIEQFQLMCRLDEEYYDNDRKICLRHSTDAVTTKSDWISECTKGLSSPDPALQFAFTDRFRRLLSVERNPPIQKVIDAGVVPQLVEFLHRHDFPQLQLQAAWALTNIASGTSDHTRVVVEAKAVPAFVQLLSSPDEDVREQAAWGLGNVAGDSVELKDLVLQQGAFPALLQLFDDATRPSTTRNAVWTLSNLCRGKPAPDLNVLRPALPYLARLIASNDEETVSHACWALAYISQRCIQAVIDAGVVRQLVYLLWYGNTAVRIPALRTIGNIVTGDEQQTQHIIDLRALGPLLQLLDHPTHIIRKDACWTISNITAGSADQIQAVIDAGVFPKLIRRLQHYAFDIRKEAAWAVRNATSGGRPEHIAYLVDQQVIPGLKALLGESDPVVLTLALKCLANIIQLGQQIANQQGIPNPYLPVFQACGAVKKIEQLQEHDNKVVSLQACLIARAFSCHDH